jgi:hypothetical protein
MTDDDAMREAAAGWEMPAPTLHRHGRNCYDDPGPGHGHPSLVCNLIEGIDPEPSEPLPFGPGNWPDDRTNRCRRCWGEGCERCFLTGREDLDHEVELQARDRYRTQS